MTTAVRHDDSKERAPGDRVRPGKWHRAPRVTGERRDSPMTANHTQPGRVLDHTPAAMLRRMGNGSARALKKVVSSCDMRRVGA